MKFCKYFNLQNNYTDQTNGSTISQDASKKLARFINGVTSYQNKQKSAKTWGSAFKKMSSFQEIIFDLESLTTKLNTLPSVSTEKLSLDLREKLKVRASKTYWFFFLFYLFQYCKIQFIFCLCSFVVLYLFCKSKWRSSVQLW